MANNDYITTDCKLTVSKNTAKLDEEIFLYKNDRNIKLLIEIVDNKYRYKSDDLSNLLVKYKASYAQVKWYKNAEVKKEFPIQATDDGKVVFVIEGQLIDEDTELGDYDLQLRLLNESQESIRSLPIIKGAVHILKPLFEEGDIATVNSAVADVSMLSLDGDAIDTYNSDGTYNQTNWGSGDIISSSKLNKLEKVAKDNVDKVNKIPAKSIVEGGKIYLAKEDGTKLDSGTELPAGGSTIEVVNNLESDSTTAALSAAQGKALNTQYKDIVNKKIDNVTLSDNVLTFFANSKTIKTITLPTSITGGGTNGKEIELQKSTTHIQWRYVGDTDWTNLVALSDLKGDKGDTGEGVVSGGTTGQILAKKSNTDYDTEWIDAPSTGGSSEKEWITIVDETLKLTEAVSRIKKTVDTDLSSLNEISLYAEISKNTNSDTSNVIFTEIDFGGMSFNYFSFAKVTSTTGINIHIKYYLKEPKPYHEKIENVASLAYNTSNVTRQLSVKGSITSNNISISLDKAYMGTIKLQIYGK